MQVRRVGPVLFRGPVVALALTWAGRAPLWGSWDAVHEYWHTAVCIDYAIALTNLRILWLSASMFVFCRKLRVEEIQSRANRDRLSLKTISIQYRAITTDILAPNTGRREKLLVAAPYP